MKHGRWSCLRRVLVLFAAILSGLITQTGFTCETNPTMTGLENATTQLEENEMEVTGQLSLNTLEGSDWLLTRMGNKQSLPGDAEVTLSFAAGRISGRSACNRYSADISDGDNPGGVQIGPTMGTRMACADHLMEIESVYLKALGLVSSFSFHSGNLSLNGLNEDGTPFSMLFTSVGMGPQIEL